MLAVWTSPCPPVQPPDRPHCYAMMPKWQNCGKLGTSWLENPALLLPGLVWEQEHDGSPGAFTVAWQKMGDESFSLVKTAFTKDDAMSRKEMLFYLSVYLCESWPGATRINGWRPSTWCMTQENFMFFCPNIKAAFSSLGVACVSILKSTGDIKRSINSSGKRRMNSAFYQFIMLLGSLFTSFF